MIQIHIYMTQIHIVSFIVSIHTNPRLRHAELTGKQIECACIPILTDTARKRQIISQRLRINRESNRDSHNCPVYTQTRSKIESQVYLLLSRHDAPPNPFEIPPNQIMIKPLQRCGQHRRLFFQIMVITIVCLNHHTFRKPKRVGKHTPGTPNSLEQADRQTDI